MNYCIVTALVLVLSVQVSPAPFFPFFNLHKAHDHAERRQYEVPPPIKTSYESPEAYEAPPPVKTGYDAPDVYEIPPIPEVKQDYSAPTTTSTPCSYEPPTTAAPAYSPARNPVFPDVFGFIRNVFKPKTQNAGYNPCLSAPTIDGYEAPPKINDLYAIPSVIDGYKSPEEPTYKAPEEESSYKAPEEPTYKAPEEPSYKAPEEPTYEAPEEPSYKAPEESSYKAPEEPSYKAPEESSYKAPEEPTYKAPEEPTYKAPEEPTYKAPEEESSYKAPDAPKPSYSSSDIQINQRSPIVE